MSSLPRSNPWSNEGQRTADVVQPRMETGEDAATVPMLDPKVWVALRCPTDQLELDARTLAFLDSNHDGRIRLPEVREAVEWALAMLKDPKWLEPNGQGLAIDAINTSSAEGRALYAKARELCAEGQGALTVAQVDAAIDHSSSARFNGDGIVTAASSSDAPTRRVVADIIAMLGAAKDASGDEGIDRARADTFFAAVRAHHAWWERRERDESLLPFRDQTDRAVIAFKAASEKVDDYFARCALVAMDSDARLNPPGPLYEGLAGASLSSHSPQVAALPLSRIESDRPLPLRRALNPAWDTALADLAADCLQPAGIEGETLTSAQWQALRKTLTPHLKYLEEKPASPVDALGTERLRALAKDAVQASILALFEEEDRAAEGSKTLQALSKLVHYQRDLLRFLNNFVSFGEFYAKGDAIFEAGTLYLDGRACELCLKVTDVTRHAVLAVHSMIYVLYCDCVRKSDNAKLTIAAAMTNGSSDFLMVGRNGVFVDRHGQDWDATVTRIIDQPISVREAFWSPYKRMARFIADQVERFAGANDKSNPLATVVTPHGPATVPVAAAPAAPTNATFDAGKFAGIFAAVGLALGAVGTAFASIISGFLGLQAWQMPLAVGGALLLVSGPSMLLAAMKLRQRNLGPLLDASGWAVNSRARISIPFGKSLTRLPKLDAFSRRRNVWPMFLFVMVILGALIAFASRNRIVELFHR